MNTTSKGMKYEKIVEYSNTKFRRITGVKRATFEKMVEILRKGYAEKHRRRGRKPVCKGTSEK